MLEENITAETNEEVIEDAGETSEQEATETKEEPAEEVKAEPIVEEKPKQDNSANARRRREAERKREIEEAETNAIIRVVGKNPYTGEKLTDKASVDVYLDMKAISDKGGDPVQEYAGYIVEKNRRNAEEREQKRQAEERFTQERDEFIEKYPDVDLNELATDEDFQDYAEGKLGGAKTLSQVYASYQSMMAKYEKKAQDQAVRMVANGNSSAGSLKNANALDNKVYTMEEVAKMSDEEYARADKSGAIARSKEAWYKQY